MCVYKLQPKFRLMELYTKYWLWPIYVYIHIYLDIHGWIHLMGHILHKRPKRLLPSCTAKREHLQETNISNGKKYLWCPADVPYLSIHWMVCFEPPQIPSCGFWHFLFSCFNLKTAESWRANSRFASVCWSLGKPPFLVWW